MNLLLSQIKELSDEELRARVASVLGWRREDEDSPLINGMVLHWYIRPDGERQAEPWPNYPESLDAIHEAEKTLLANWQEPNSPWEQYQRSLIRVMNIEESELPVEAAPARPARHCLPVREAEHTMMI